VAWTARRLGKIGESKGTWQRVVFPGYRWTSPSGENLAGTPFGYNGRDDMSVFDSDITAMGVFLCCCLTTTFKPKKSGGVEI
jgi:hypothetical protein